MELDSEESEWFHFLPVLPMTPRLLESQAERGELTKQNVSSRSPALSV